MEDLLGESITKYLVALAASINAYFSFSHSAHFQTFGSTAAGLCATELCAHRNNSPSLSALHTV